MRDLLLEPLPGLSVSRPISRLAAELDQPLPVDVAHVRREVIGNDNVAKVRGSVAAVQVDVAQAAGIVLVVLVQLVRRASIL